MMRLLKNPLLLTIYASFIAGLTIEELHIFADQIPYYIALMLYFSFPGLNFNIKKIFRKETIIALFLCGFFMPVLAWYVFSYGQIEEYRTGMFLVAASPAGIIMLVISRSIENADYELIVGNFLLSHISLIAYLPLLVYLFQGSSVHLSVGKIFLNTILLISIPWIFAYATHRFAGEKGMNYFHKISKFVNPMLFFIVISSSLANALKKIELDLSLAFLFFLVLGIYLSQSFAAFILGRILFNEKSGNSLALSGSSKNIQLTLGIAVLNYDILTTVPIVLGIITHHISNGFWIWLFTKKQKES